MVGANSSAVCESDRAVVWVCDLCQVHCGVIERARPIWAVSRWVAVAASGAGMSMVARAYARQASHAACNCGSPANVKVNARPPPLAGRVLVRSGFERCCNCYGCALLVDQW